MKCLIWNNIKLTCKAGYDRTNELFHMAYQKEYKGVSISLEKCLEKLVSSSFSFASSPSSCKCNHRCKSISIHFHKASFPNLRLFSWIQKRITFLITCDKVSR